MRSPETRGRLDWIAGAALLALAAGVAVLLALWTLGAADLPGCGVESGCERAFASAWGALPVAGWPTAFAGASYFAALLAAWLVGREGWPRGLAWVARLGALASLALLAALLVQKTPCAYCAAVHAANLAFLVFSERRAGTARSALAPALAFGTVLAGSTLALAGARSASGASALARAERELESSTRAIVERGPEQAPFTGRHRLGPEEAPIRIVVFSDYQCEDCARIERELAALLARRPDVALSTKHFPLCVDCNRKARELGQNRHANACWAARAAEAAGIVGGSPAFWRMHRWLFERGGQFDEAELRAALPGLELAADPLLRAMHGPATLALVEADVEEALQLGLHVTPMIFLNGVELRGWNAPRALERALEALGAPRAASAAADRPPSAVEKYLEDWRSEPRVVVPPAGRGEPERPPGAASVDVVLWGDYREPNTRALDARTRAALEQHPLARYSFRHYPMDRACGAELPDRSPGACLSARAAEAAWIVGGSAAFERMHAWLMASEVVPDEALLARQAQVQGLDPAAFTRALASPRALDAIRADVSGARALGIHSIPLLLVDGRRVPRWKLEGERVPELVIEEACTR